MSKDKVVKAVKKAVKKIPDKVAVKKATRVVKNKAPELTVCTNCNASGMACSVCGHGRLADDGVV